MLQHIQPFPAIIMTQETPESTETIYLNRSGSYYPTLNSALNAHPMLPIGTYTVGQNPDTGAYFLAPIEDYQLPGKIYGNTINRSDRIINTFLSRNDRATGVLLAGEKGSGKTMLAKQLSIRARALGMATIVINSGLCGEAFNQFMQTIRQPIIVIFDEFEKVYHEEDVQNQILTLFDGTFPQHKLFVLTVNNVYRVNEHMRNRPGRLYYMIEYSGLTDEFIREYCEDVLNPSDHRAKQILQIVQIAQLFSNFNFDMLKALCEEMNRYGEEPLDAIELLNIKPSSDDRYLEYTVSVSVEGSEAEEIDLQSSSTVNGNPALRSRHSVSFYRKNPIPKIEGDEDYDDNVYESLILQNPRDFVAHDATTQQYTFQSKLTDGTRVTVSFTRVQTVPISVRDLIA